MASSSTQNKLYYHSSQTPDDDVICEEFIHWIEYVSEELCDGPECINWQAISASNYVTITMNMLNKYSHLPWMYYDIAYSGKITMEFVIDNYDRFKDYLYGNVCANPHLTEKDLYEYIEFIKTLPTTTEKKWKDVWHNLVARNNSLTYDFCMHYKDLISQYNHDHYNRNWNIAVRYISMTEEQYTSGNIPPHDKEHLYLNRNLATDFLEKIMVPEAMTEPVVRHNLSRNKNISLEFIEKHINNKYWDFKEVLQRPDITIEFVKKHYKKFVGEYFDRAMFYASKHPNITLKDIEENIDTIPWNKDGLWRNPNMTMTFARKYRNRFELDEHMSSFTLNPSIGMNDIYQNLDLHWEFPKDYTTFQTLFDNPNFDVVFFVNDERFKKLLPRYQRTNIKNYLIQRGITGVGFSIPLRKAAIKLQRQWRQCWYNPRYTLCKRRLLREYNELMEEFSELQNN